MGFIGIKTPFLIKKIFPNYVWSIDTKKKYLYITFDDGPTPTVTEKVLDILKQYNAKATFFCIGKNIEAHPEIYNRILAEGHSVGNHTHNHLNGWKNNTQNYIDNTLIAEQVMGSDSRVQGYEVNLKLKTQNSKLFRPPYGKIKRSQAKKLKKLGYKIIMWDVLSYDWDKKNTKEQVLKNVINNSTLGSIIVFHDSVKASENMLYTLPKVLEYYKNKSYEFKKLKV